MKQTIAFLLVALSFSPAARAQAVTETYAVDSASVEHAGVPKGEVIPCTLEKSSIFPGTRRDYWIYVPAQYRPDRPACVYVNQDGIQWKAPVVFDNLINSGEMPVTIGIFVQPGKVITRDTATGQDRFNRSFEYDGLGDAYVRFLLQELLPDAERHQTRDGRPIRLSKRGNDRAIGGSSSGAICAFTAAWERPAEFSRVFSAIGTYVGLRGGDWWMANQLMERSLTFAGYEVRHVWGEGRHNGAQGTALFPEAMRWLWKDWPRPVVKGSSSNQVLHDILIPGKDWELVGEGYGFTEGTAANAAGEVYYQDIPASLTYRVGADGRPAVFSRNAKRASGTCFAPDGSRYEVAGATRQILRYDDKGRAIVIADSIAGNDLLVARNGNVYVTVPDGTEKPSKLYMITSRGEKRVVDSGLRFINGLCFNPDQTQLYVAESASHWIWIYTVMPDGTLANKQRFGWLHTPDDQETAWPDGMKCDREGRLYVATRLGIQILDPLGRVNAILPVPSGQPSNCCFGGAEFDTLYVSSGNKVYRRQLKTRGCNPFEPPNKPAPPRL